MARSVVLFASSVVVATCCACFYLVVAAADDRQARSGDLDRGPPPLPPPNTPTSTESRNFPGKNQEALSRKPSGPSPSSSSPGQNSPSKNLEAFNRKPPSSNPSPSHPWKSDSTFDLVRKWNFNYERSPRSSAPDTPTTSSYYVGKIISGYPAQNWDLGRRGDSTLVSPSKSSKSASAGPASSNYSNETDSTPSSSHENPHRLILAMERRLEMSTEFFLVPPSPNPPNNPPTGNSPGSPVGHITKTACSGCPVETDRIAGIFRNEPWVIPVLTLSCITMVLIIGFEVFVLCKAWRTTPSRRHLFLGQMLLLGLFTCAGLGAVYAASPTQLTCAVVRFGTGVSYAIVFASLLVKCVFLISLNGGVYLPAPYQGLLLLFAILIQVAIGAQWLLTSPPLVDSITVENIVTQTTKHRLLVTAEDIASPTSVPLCRTTYTDILLSLIYVIFLILFVTVLAVKSRGIRDNYREATYIGLSVGCSIPTWLIWILSGFIVSERHRDACIAFGLVISSVLVFLIMFMPKGRQLAAMGKEGVYVEDREERFSSLSRAGSGYSPSFFHFKPMKYGLGGHGTTHKHHQHTITTIGGDLALYPPPPSYTRLYQCYPSPPGYYSTRYLPGGVFLRPDDGNVYTTLEPTLSSNPNVYFQRGNGLHPGMMY